MRRISSIKSSLLCISALFAPSILYPSISESIIVFEILSLILSNISLWERNLLSIILSLSFSSPNSTFVLLNINSLEKSGGSPTYFSERKSSSLTDFDGENSMILSSSPSTNTFPLPVFLRSFHPAVLKRDRIRNSTK
ncbi:hypothetical protein ES703_63693 [subsurface metagenome]